MSDLIQTFYRPNPAEFFAQPQTVQDRDNNSHLLFFNERDDLAKRNRLIDELSYLTAIGFMRPSTPELRLDVEEHVLGSQRLVVARYREQPSAFVASSLRTGAFGERVYHVEGIICDPAFRGLASRLLEGEIAKTKPDYLAFHTQSKRMENLGRKFANLNLLDAVNYGKLIQSRNQQGIIDVGRYDNVCLYGDVEKFAPDAIVGINFQQGDALICAGPIRLEYDVHYNQLIII